MTENSVNWKNEYWALRKLIVRFQMEGTIPNSAFVAQLGQRAKMLQDGQVEVLKRLSYTLAQGGLVDFWQEEKPLKGAVGINADIVVIRDRAALDALDRAHGTTEPQEGLRKPGEAANG